MINIKELQKKINNKSFDIKKLNKVQKIAFNELVNRGLIDLSNIKVNNNRIKKINFSNFKTFNKSNNKKNNLKPDQTYTKLIEKLYGLDRCHSGPEMVKAYNLLNRHYKGSELLKTKYNKKVNFWKCPPYWECKEATLIDSKGKIIASKEINNLMVFSYSPPVEKNVSLKELQKHLLSDPKRPDDIIYHFRNQYRFWNADWGFSIPHNIRKKLSNKVMYKVKIKSKFNFKKDLVQSQYIHKGIKKDTYMFMGHFDHASQSNDGLTGCVAAYEIIKSLDNIKTNFSYRAFASVEIVGSVFFLDKYKDLLKYFKGVIFLGFSGVNAPMVYQLSYNENSYIDKICEHIFFFKSTSKKNIYKHRELAGNDENVFDSANIDIPASTVMRWPFKDYHTEKDNLKNTKKNKIDEVISFGKKIIFILENNFKVKLNYNGLLSVSSPEINLYFEDFRYPKIPPIQTQNQTDDEKNAFIKKTNNLFKDLDYQELEYVKSKKKLLGKLMKNFIRMSDGKNTLLDIAEKSQIPFSIVLNYAVLFKEKKLITLS